MSGYTKLFSSIIHSTIWREEAHVKLVWITMLAMKDRDGVVEASMPGLADAARVSLQQCQEALERLSAPDPFSRSPEFDGRRIETIHGGWLILNHGAYQDRLSADDVREKARLRQAAKRDRDLNRHALSRNVTPRHASSRHVEVDVEVDADAEAEVARDKPSRATRSGDDGFAAFWSVYPKKRAKATAEKVWKALRPDSDLQRTIIDAVKLWSRADDWTKSSGQFIPHPATWLRGGQWEDSPGAALSGVMSVAADNQRARTEVEHRGCYGAGMRPSCHRGVCVTMKMAVEWRDRLDASVVNPDEYLCDFISRTLREIPGTIGEDRYVFWRKAWNRQHGNAITAPSNVVTKADITADAVQRVLAKHRRGELPGIAGPQ